MKDISILPQRIKGSIIKETDNKYMEYETRFKRVDKILSDWTTEESDSKDIYSVFENKLYN